VKGTVHDVEQGRTFLREQVIPSLKQAPGFVSGAWVKLGENEGTSIIIFDSEEAARAGAEQLRQNPPPSSAVALNSIEIGEVVEQA
jgi:hypothetical protein